MPWERLCGGSRAAAHRGCDRRGPLGGGGVAWGDPRGQLYPRTVRRMKTWTGRVKPCVAPGQPGHVVVVVVG